MFPFATPHVEMRDVVDSSRDLGLFYDHDFLELQEMMDVRGSLDDNIVVTLSRSVEQGEQQSHEIIEVRDTLVESDEISPSSTQDQIKQPS